MERAALAQARIRFLATFACPSLEQDFRRNHLHDDLRLAIGCSLVAFAGSIIYLVCSSIYGTAADIFTVLLMRAPIILASVGLILILRRYRCPMIADRAIMTWSLVAACGNLIAIAIGFAGTIGQGLMSFGIPLIAYLVLPLPVARQLLVVIPFSMGAILAGVIAGNNLATVLILIGAYLTSNGIGAYASWQVNRRRREVYLAAVRETELRSQLEQAMAEVKTLRGLLPICAWCRRIRDEEQAWQTVEDYVRSHTDADFTHGICENCMENQIERIGSPLVASGRRG